MPSLSFDAAVFDLDGVLTRTDRLHVSAWKEMLDEYLARRAERRGTTAVPFDPEEEYREYVDGRPRYDGLAAFLESRGIDLPRGEPSDPPGRETVCGLGNRKQEIFRAKLREEGADRIELMLGLARALREKGIAIAFATSSRNGRRVVQSAGIEDIAEVLVDGVRMDELELAGKPSPDIFLEAVRRLGVEPGRAVLFEDARAGVEAGRVGGFGLVVGVVEAGREHVGLLSAGADLVAETEDPPSVEELDGWFRRRGDRLPSALGSRELENELGSRRPAFFLDFDGTLAPIVRRPEDAAPLDSMSEILRQLARRFPVAVVSGRGRPDVKGRVGLEEIYYAGSHGFDISGPGGETTFEAAAAVVPVVESVTRRLEEELGGIEGAQVEPKRFTVAVHYRRVADGDVPRVEEIVDRRVAERPELRKAGGKKVWEIRPAIDWDKGRAVEWLLEALGFDEGDVVPIYVGDDETDEDAFRALAARDPVGIGILVARVPRPTAAGYWLKDPAEVREWLGKITKRES